MKISIKFLDILASAKLEQFLVKLWTLSRVVVKQFWISNFLRNKHDIYSRDFQMISWAKPFEKHFYILFYFITIYFYVLITLPYFWCFCLIFRNKCLSLIFLFVSGYFFQTLNLYTKDVYSEKWAHFGSCNEYQRKHFS